MKSLILVLSTGVLSLSLMACSSSGTTPSLGATNNNSDSPPALQAASSLDTASETAVGAETLSDAPITTQSVPGEPRYNIDRSRCAWINNGGSREFETCISSFLNSDPNAGMFVSTGVGSQSFVPFNKVQSFCQRNLQACVNQANYSFKRILDATELNGRCSYNAGRELKMSDTRMKSIKFGVVLGGNALIAAGGTYAAFKIVDWPHWLRAASAGSAAALATAFNEWAFAWLYTASFNNSGHSVVGAMMVASYKMASNLPEYFRAFDYAGVVREVQMTCPPNAHFVADEL